MTKNHIPGGLEQQEFILSKSGGRESDVKVRQGHGLSEGFGGGPSLPLPASGGCWQSLVFLSL